MKIFSCIKGVLTVVFVLGVISDAWGQQPMTSGRPKIGLVLSGGGAKGAAHIGVIKVLEEKRIPIDYVVGTSMGAVIGALYASGMSASQLEEAAQSIDWLDIFEDKPARRDRDFRRKLEDEGFLVRYKFGIKDGAPTFPSGLIYGQKLELTLRRLMKSTIGVQDFDKLQIPFRAVAADIENGDTVVLGSGDLVKALRASMAISGIFPPVELNHRVLVDGGLANNVPIDVARKLGADIVIVVGFPSDLKTRDQLKGALAIIGQSLDLLISQNSKIQLKTLKSEDIYIEPPIGNIRAGDFARFLEAIDLGEKAARASPVTQKLNELASQVVKSNLAFEYRSAPTPKEIIIDDIKINNNSGLSDQIILSRIRQKVGQILDIKRLEDDISTVYGLDYFSTVEYKLENIYGRTVLLITVNEKPTGLNSLRFGVNLESNFSGESDFNFSIRYQREGINKLGGEVLLEAIAGEKVGAKAVYLQPWDVQTRYFSSVGLSYLSRNIDIFDGGTKDGELRVSEIVAALGLARQFDGWGLISVGAESGLGWIDVNTGNIVSSEDSYGVGRLLSRFSIDTFDELDFPKTGTKGFAEISHFTKALGHDEKFNKVSGLLSTALTSGRNTFIFSGSGGLSFDGVTPVQDLYSVGGLFNFSGYQAGSLSAENFALGRILFYRSIGSKGLAFNMPVYLGASLEGGNLWGRKNSSHDEDLIIATSAFVGVDSPLGPVYLAIGQAEGGENSLYFYLGQYF